MKIVNKPLLWPVTLASWKIVVEAVRRFRLLLQTVDAPVPAAVLVALVEHVEALNRAALMVPLVKGLIVVVVTGQFVEKVLNAVDPVEE